MVSTYFVTLAPVIIGDAIDSFKEGTMTMRSIWLTLTYLMGAVAAGAMGSLVVRRTILVASYNIQFDVRRDLFNHFTDLEAEYFDNNRVGDLIARLTADLNAVRQMTGMVVFQSVNVGFLLIFTLFRMFKLNSSLALMTLILVPVISLAFWLLLRVVKKR